jgi:predicted nucleotidyltransferase
MKIDNLRNIVNEIAPLYNMQSERLFGSDADGRARADSDVDLLVEPSPTDDSYLTIFGFKEHMQRALGVDVDVLEYPIKKQRLFSRKFRLGKVAKIYG